MTRHSLFVDEADVSIEMPAPLVLFLGLYVVLVAVVLLVAL